MPPVLPSSVASLQRRDIWLDVLRFGAIFLVLGSHLRDIPADCGSAMARFALLWKRGGWVGVDLFFVLSGYLVSSLLLAEIQKTGKASISRFLIRRGFKIYPSFYLALAFTLAWRLASTDDSLSRGRLVGELFFLQNYVGMYWQHHWSLAVEEHFYLLLALGVCITQQIRSRYVITLKEFRWLPWAWAASVLSCLVLRMRVGLELPFDVHTHLIPTHLRIDSLMTGTLLSWLMHQRFPMFRPRQQTRLFLLLSGVALFIPPFVWDFTQFWWVLPFGASLHAVGASMLILAGFSGQSSGSATMKCMAWIGARSYNIYLWHMPWLFWLNPMLCRHLGIQDNWALCTALYLAGSVILGTLMTTAVERPFLRIRDSIFPSRATPLPATT